MKTGNTAQCICKYDTDEWGDKETRSKPKHKNKERGNRDSKRGYDSPQEED